MEKALEEELARRTAAEAKFAKYDDSLVVARRERDDARRERDAASEVTSTLRMELACASSATKAAEAEAAAAWRAAAEAEADVEAAAERTRARARGDDSIDAAEIFRGWTRAPRDWTSKVWWRRCSTSNEETPTPSPRRREKGARTTTRDGNFARWKSASS